MKATLPAFDADGKGDFFTPATLSFITRDATRNPFLLFRNDLSHNRLPLGKPQTATRYLY
jgi:hypothetical protein